MDFSEESTVTKTPMNVNYEVYTSWENVRNLFAERVKSLVIIKRLLDAIES